MTRRDSEVDVNDAEGDRSSNGGCTSREASASSSSNEKSLGEKNTRKGSKVLDDESKLMVRQDRLVISEAGGKDIEKIVNDERKEKKDEYRDSKNFLEAVDSEESVRQSFCKKMDNCLAQVMEATVACGPVSSTTINAAIFTSASGSSTPICDTRLPASILFELPDSCGTSNTESTDKMPAITKAQMKEFEEAFNLFDKDRDGSITKEELGRVMRGLGQFARTEELRTMLEEIDTDGDGNVSLVEFVKIVSNIGSANAAAPTDLSQEEQEEQELRDAFRVFDKHNRGYITASDLRAVLQCLGEDLSEEEIEDMIKEVDEDGDGRIDFYEFARSLVEPGTDDEDEDDDEEELPQSP